MSAVDYGYAASNCPLSAEMKFITVCKDNNWIIYTTTMQWTISPQSIEAKSVWMLNSAGSLSNSSSTKSYGVRPVVYLNSNVKIIDGKGTQSLPYIIS